MQTTISKIDRQIDRQIDRYERWIQRKRDNLPEPRQDEEENDSVDNADYDIEETAEDGWEQQLLTLVLKLVRQSRNKINLKIR